MGKFWFVNRSTTTLIGRKHLDLSKAAKDGVCVWRLPQYSLAGSNLLLLIIGVKHKISNHRNLERLVVNEDIYKCTIFHNDCQNFQSQKQCFDPSVLATNSPKAFIKCPKLQHACSCGDIKGRGSVGERLLHWFASVCIRFEAEPYQRERD